MIRSALRLHPREQKCYFINFDHKASRIILTIRTFTKLSMYHTT